MNWFTACLLLAQRRTAKKPEAMHPVLDWSAYKDAGMGDVHADIPRHGGDFAKAVAVGWRNRSNLLAQAGRTSPRTARPPPGAVTQVTH